MYTVKELIETLKQCPEDYPIDIWINHDHTAQIEAIAINTEYKYVGIFLEDEE